MDLICRRFIIESQALHLPFSNDDEHARAGRPPLISYRNLIQLILPVVLTIIQREYF